MKLLQKFFRNDEKLNANEIAVCTDETNNKYKKLDKAVGTLSNLNTVDKSSIVNAINEINTRNIMSLKFTHAKSVSSTEVLATFSENELPETSSFTLKNDGTVQIGENVSLIRVIANVSIQDQTTSGGQKRIILKKNGATVGTSYSHTTGGISFVSTTCCIDRIIAVSSGDIISIYASSNSTSVVLGNEFSSCIFDKIK